MQELEEAIEPELPVIDAHHHLYDRPNNRYLLPDLLNDVVRSGHDIRATVFVQARSMFREDGPVSLRSLGETEFARDMAVRCRDDRAGKCSTLACAAIVGEVDLSLGEAASAVLQEHITSGGGYFRGVRQIAAWDEDRSLLNTAYPTTEDMLGSSDFREGFAQLAPLDLSFDAWIYYPQIPKLISLARDFPETRIVVNHCGGIVRAGRFAALGSDVYIHWAAALVELASCPNVMIKLSGLGMPLSSFGFDESTNPATSEQLSIAWRPWIEHCIATFGTGRCMFASNFPADRVSYAYGTGWNAMKRIVADASPSEKQDLFWTTASNFYKLDAVARDAQWNSCP